MQSNQDVLAPLREATGEMHASLDAGLPLARPGASLADYADHLLALRPWLAEVGFALAHTGEAGLAPFAARIDDKLRALNADLADLAIAGRPLPPSANPAARDTDETLLAEASASIPGYGWGLVYVVEGSHLGGAVLHKRLRERLAPHPLRYLSGTGARGVGAGWSSTVAQLGEALGDADALSGARQGAVAAFQRLMLRFEWPAPAGAAAP
ncbi:biliverdin-producing heme oxygenase [Variovorax robiniae]|uniref:Biliverdin-producing heme oxygenase n=1 Tax=Variovorax robiniae TaxID=1836199 RepID=A0ABU8XEX6_9BURK